MRMDGNRTEENKGGKLGMGHPRECDVWPRKIIIIIHKATRAAVRCAELSIDLLYVISQVPARFPHQ